MPKQSPVYHIISVPIEKIVPNDYNPNAVAPPELKLLYDSIKQDGYTMPIVCYHNKENDTYIIVDGFHRYRIMLDHPDIYEREGDKWIAKHLGMDRDEILRLKQITGLAALFRDIEFSHAWEPIENLPDRDAIAASANPSNDKQFV